MLTFPEFFVAAANFVGVRLRLGTNARLGECVNGVTILSELDTLPCESTRGWQLAMGLCLWGCFRQGPVGSDENEALTATLELSLCSFRSSSRTLTGSMG